MPTQLNLVGAGCAPLQAQASVGLISPNLTAVGSSQGTALVLGTDFNVIASAAASTGVLLPTCGAIGNQYLLADSVYIVNHGANSITVYPPVGGKVANGSTNAGLALAATKTGVYQVVGVNLWSASVSA